MLLVGQPRGNATPARPRNPRKIGSTSGPTFYTAKATLTGVALVGALACSEGSLSEPVTLVPEPDRAELIMSLGAASPATPVPSESAVAIAASTVTDLGSILDS